MEPSILNSIKKVLGVAESYTAFDRDILMHINATIFILNQLGVNPIEDDFVVEDKATSWDDFLGTDDKVVTVVKTFMYLKVRLLFDPPATSFHIKAMEDQLNELAFRIQVNRSEEAV